MPNTENINALIARLERLREPTSTDKFLMSDWKETTECGTVACLGGWAEVVMAKDKPLAVLHVTDWLGITLAQGDELFFTRGFCRFVDDLSEHARITAGIKALTILRDEDRVDWEAAIDYALKQENPTP